MRLFIAIPLSQEITNHIEEIQQKLPKQTAQLTIAKHPHITIKFLGETTPSDTKKIQEELSAIRFQSFQAKTNGIGLFTDQVIWVGVDPHKPLDELRKKVNTSLKELFPKNDKFHPHITLARIKKILDEKDFKNALKKIEIKDLKFTIDKFVLMQSTTDSNGSAYKELMTYYSYE